MDIYLPIAGLSVNGVEARMKPEVVDAVALNVRDAAGRISAELNGS